jgi:hypothetical protein
VRFRLRGDFLSQKRKPHCGAAAFPPPEAYLGLLVVQAVTRVPLSLSVWVLGWPTRCLCADNPTSCASNTKLYRCSLIAFSTFAGPLPAPATPAPAAHSTAASLAVPPCAPLRLLLVQPLELCAVSRSNSPLSHCPSSSTPLPQLLLVVC